MITNYEARQFTYAVFLIDVALLLLTISEHFFLQSRLGLMVNS